MRGKRANFSDYFPRRARILVTTHVWNDAVAAAVVAPNEHRYERLEATVHVRGKRLGHHVLAKLEPREPPVCDNLRNESDRARPNGEVELRKLLEHVFTKALHGTAHKPSDLLRGNQVARLADGLFLGLLPDSTAVDDDEFRVFLADGLLVPRRHEHRLDGFRVAHVHLTTVCMDMKLHSRLCVMC